MSTNTKTTTRLTHEHTNVEHQDKQSTSQVSICAKFAAVFDSQRWCWIALFARLASSFAVLVEQQRSTPKSKIFIDRLFFASGYPLRARIVEVVYYHKRNKSLLISRFESLHKNRVKPRVVPTRGSLFN
jgi:hypothetical protein